jgi:hypothetical protein
MSKISRERLTRELRVDEEDAEKLRKLIRYHDHRSVDASLDFANKAMEAHGIEAIHDPSRWDNYYTDMVALYVNTGDTYSATLIYDVERDTYLVQDWATWVERYERRTGRRLP